MADVLNLAGNPRELEFRMKVNEIVQKWKNHMVENRVSHGLFTDTIPANDDGSFVYALHREIMEKNGMHVESVSTYPVGAQNNVMLRHVCFFVKMEKAPVILKA